MFRPLLAGAAALAACVALSATVPAQQLFPPGSEPLPPPPAERSPEPLPGFAADGDEADGPGEVLTRGPVHEAFAEPVTFNPQPGFIAPKPPPEPVEELPPDQRPEGENVAWISGYWSWDDDRKDYIWVSGIYRTVPPGRQWVPGYWNRVAEGYQWVPGMWASAKGDVEYFPAPPDSLEVGPSSEPPTVDHIWVPGHWTWRETRYAWRAGYWTPAHAGWIWVPAHYVWTPHGYVFVPGFWDLPLERRGLLFAPVYFDPVVIVRPRFYYRPRVVISTGILTAHLFCRPAYHHYCFGDYYAASYVHVGIFPWFSFHIERRGYCPIYAHHHWHHAHHHDVHWHVSLRREYEHRRDHVDARPPRTFVAQQTVINNIQNNTVINRNVNVRQMTLAQPLNEVARSRDSSLRLERVNREQQEQLRDQAREVRRFQEERGRLETSARGDNHGGPRGRNSSTGPSRLELRSPVAARSATNEGRQADGNRQPDGNRQGDGSRGRDGNRGGDGNRSGDRHGSRTGDRDRQRDFDPPGDGRKAPRPSATGQGSASGQNNAAGQGTTPRRNNTTGQGKAPEGSPGPKQTTDGGGPGRGKSGATNDGPPRGSRQGSGAGSPNPSAVGPRVGPKPEGGSPMPRAKENRPQAPGGNFVPPAKKVAPKTSSNPPVPRPQTESAPRNNSKPPQVNSENAAPRRKTQGGPPPGRKEEARSNDRPTFVPGGGGGGQSHRSPGSSEGPRRKR
jgi:hypothetical protein